NSFRTSHQRTQAENGGALSQETLDGYSRLRVQTIIAYRYTVSRGGDMPAKKFDLPALFDVRGRTAVITGGSGHFGRAMALALAQAGVHVAILGRHVETAQTVADTIQAEGGSALGIACDVLSHASLEQSREQ